MLEENKDFYNELYDKKNSVSHFIHMMVSFDQQSKAKLNRKFLSPYIKQALADLDKGDITLLDFGSGWGSFLLKAPRKMKLYCFDLSKQSMEAVSKTLGYLGFEVFHAKVRDDSNIDPKGLNFIVCSHVLEHVDNDVKLLEMFHRALSEDGVLLVNVPINEVWEDPKHVRAYTVSTMRKLLVESGFQVLVESEEDKWTGFLLEKEFAQRQTTTAIKFFVRALRLLLALTPLYLVKYTEKVLFSGRAYQQLILIVGKVSKGQEIARKLL